MPYETERQELSCCEKLLAWMCCLQASPVESRARPTESAVRSSSQSASPLLVPPESTETHNTAFHQPYRAPSLPPPFEGPRGETTEYSDVETGTDPSTDQDESEHAQLLKKVQSPPPPSLRRNQSAGNTSSAGHYRTGSEPVPRSHCQSAGDEASPGQFYNILHRRTSSGELAVGRRMLVAELVGFLQADEAAGKSSSFGGLKFCKSGSGKSLQEEEEECCPTCLEEYTDDNPRIITKCSHHFHLGCIYEWMERSTRCPVCDKEMVFDENFV
ncbi:hypothetical protein CYMTET_7527 [Cymbomonas tetramitiformis]|uniref:RING-type E3 ubiquitin transferase n=1 Tax=Cymbomonas tetramitiformis TaxID=36881 RepID=A0AAE0GUU5_9CHLO|nr:hypothetical protein CYMTET_7527 [Cymbomonas tetramitiformis]